MHLADNYKPLPVLDPLRGDIVPVHDPSLVRRSDGTYVVFTTDLPFLHKSASLAQRCSSDLITWRSCGDAFAALPGWVQHEFPQVHGLWAPDISYFHGTYHLYYAASVFGTQNSAIGLATNVILDPSSPQYQWVDHGIVLRSHPGGDFNAIDPNILIEPATDKSGRPHIWLSYGSFWSGLYQQEIDPDTGQLLSGGVRYHLAQQPRSRNSAIEGAAMAHHNGWYYLFASVGICCDIPIEKDTYQEIVGRSRSPHGLFLDERGSRLLKGAGTVLLRSDPAWLAPGGGSLWQSPDEQQTLIAFHALHRSENGALDLWVMRVTWQNDWPVLSPTSKE